MTERDKKEINLDDLPIRLYKYNLRYFSLLERILKVYPPDLALIHRLAKAKNDNNKRVNIPFNDFRRKTSWYKTIRRLSKQDIGLLKLKTSKKHTHHILISEISFTTLWRKVIEEWRDSILFQFLESIPSDCFKTPQHFITYILPNLLLYPDQKIRQIDFFKIKRKTSAKTIEFKDTQNNHIVKLSLEFETINPQSISNDGYGEIFTNSQCIIECRNCNRSSIFNIKPKTYFYYKNSGRKYKRGCHHCVFPNKRTKFIIDFQKETIETKRYYTDNDLKLINPADLEKVDELTEEQKEKVKFIYSPDYKEISIDIIYQILLKYERGKDFELNTQTLKIEAMELYEGIITKYLSNLTVFTNKKTKFSNFVEDNVDILLKGVIKLLDQKSKGEIDSIASQKKLRETKDLIQNYLEKKEAETKALDKIRQEIPVLIKRITEKAIRYAFKEGREADFELFAELLDNLARESLIKVYNSQFKDKININIFKENATKSINIFEILNKTVEILDFRALIHNSIIEFMNISYYLNKCELDKELIIKRIFNNFDKLLDKQFPNYQDKEFLKGKLKIFVKLELTNQISLAQEAYDKIIEKD